MSSRLSTEDLNEVLCQLDATSASNAAMTCKRLAAGVRGLRRLGFIPVTGPSTGTATVSFALTSSASSKNADEESLANTDTDMPSTPEEDEWEFQVTPEIIRRLSLIPTRDTAPSLALLPNELKLEIFSYLDLIDSTCLGLTAPNLYVAHRAIHGTKIPLNTRRIGPNKLESAWEVVGKQECKQCGIYRCELHSHIKAWMPKELEYCSMKVNFGLPAGEHAVHQTCFRGKPSKPKRCGRHPSRTTSVHQDDASFALPLV
ncbi:F-box domain-containing protein [Diplocarpon rosae]|nr:F-box domain-containing protein [Diplocarpon rosae]